MEQRKRLYCLIIFGPIVQKQTDLSPVWSYFHQREQNISWSQILVSTAVKGCSYFCSYYVASAFYQMGSLSSKIFPVYHSLGQVKPNCWEASEQPVRSSSEAGTLHRQILNHDHLVSRKPIWGLGQLINCRKTLPTWSSMLFLYSPAQSSPNQSSASLSASIWGEDRTTKIELMCDFMTLLSI